MKVEKVELIKTDGYEEVRKYSVLELTRMYRNQGLSHSKSLQLAKKVRKQINRLNKKELRTWERAKNNEIAVNGLIYEL